MTLRASVLVGVRDKLLERLDGRVIPEVALSKVFSSRRVLYAACLIGEIEGEPRALPFVPQPRLHAQLRPAYVEANITHVLDAHLRYNRELPQGFCIGVPSGVRDAFVPD